MIHARTEEEIEKIRVSAALLGRAHGEVAKMVGPGVRTIDLDRRAEEFIRDNAAEPSFKGHNGFPASLCISVNEQIVHGFPSSRELIEGDVISVDCGVFLEGFHSDSAYTYPVGEISPEVKGLLDATKESLQLGIEQAVAGQRTGDIGFAIQTYVEAKGYSVVRELVGHGVGRHLHEPPEVPNYGKRGRGQKLFEGVVIAIEPMVNLGSRRIVQESDGWTIRTMDRMPSAHFEHTVVVQKGKAEVLTTFSFIEEALSAKA